MPRLLTVLAGCNYRDNNRNLPVLRGAEHDAWSLAQLFHDHPPPNGDPGSMTLLLGPAATTASITEALQSAVEDQGAEDTLLFYFAGHGVVDPVEGVLLETADGRYSRGLFLPILTGRQYPPKPAVLLLDCCHAAAFGGMPPADAPREPGAAAPTPIPTIHAIYATGADDPAYEEEGRGRFTATLLEVMTANLTLLRLPFDVPAWFQAVRDSMGAAGRAAEDRGRAIAFDQPFREDQFQQTAVLS